MQWQLQVPSAGQGASRLSDVFRRPVARGPHETSFVRGNCHPGLLISAVANELFPLLKPSDKGQATWPLLIGFTVGLIFM